MRVLRLISLSSMSLDSGLSIARLQKARLQTWVLAFGGSCELKMAFILMNQPVALLIGPPSGSFNC